MQELPGSRAARFQDVALALAPRTFAFEHLQKLHGFPMVNVPAMVFDRELRILREGATDTMIPGVEIPRTVFSHDSRSSRRSSHVDSWRWNPDNCVLNPCSGI
eukprot:9066100-Pyramimonas_sp.AAC.1